MKQRNFPAVRFLIFIIVFLLIGGGRSFIAAGDNLHSIISHHQSRDLAAPVHHELNDNNDDEKWLESCILKTSSQENPVSYYPLPQNFRPQYFPGSVWQPPKSF
jgi:hypothetical protein